VPADPDPDGVSLVAAVSVGVLAGARLAAAAPALVATVTLAVILDAVLLAQGRPRSGQGVRPRAGSRSARPLGPAPAPGPGPGLAQARRPGRGPASGPGARRPVLAGAVGLAALAVTGAAAAGVRVAATQGALLPRLAGRGGTAALQGTVAEEPRTVRYGGVWVVLSVGRVDAGGRAWRTRERAGLFLPRGAGPLAVGDQVRLRAGVERSDRADPLGGEPPVVLRRPRIEATRAARSLPLRASEAVRTAARRRVLADLPRERAGLLVGMALGDTSLLGADLDRSFKAAGLTHLVAVSGQNVAVVLAAGLGLALAFGARRPALAGIGIVLVVLFALLTRWEPSVLRASAMAVLTLLGVATGRGPGGRRALCLAVMLLLLANPALVTSLGFQLSVAATAGVLWLGPLAARLLPARLPEMVRAGVGISLGAQAGALPVLALTLGQVSLAGLAANLVAVPAATLPMLLGVVAAATAMVAAPLSTLACRLADPFLAVLVAIADHASGLPAASLTVSGPARLGPTLVVAACTLLGRRRVAALEQRSRGAGGQRRGVLRR
jgi:competence protein ComEC